MICIVGASGSGKDTLLNIFEKLGFKRVVSHTTRPKRSGEINGVNYHFVSEEKFDQLEKDGQFVETTKYHLWRYGVLAKYCTRDAVFVIEPIGLENLKIAMGTKDLFVIKIDTDEHIRLARLKARGDDPEEVQRRGREFDDFTDYSVRITNNRDTESLTVLAKHLLTAFGLRSLLK